MTSPGRCCAPAQTTGTLTEPGVALTVPCALIAFDQTGKVHRGEVGDVANAGVDDQADDAVRARRLGQQLAEHAVGRFRRRRHHQDVARRADSIGGVDHQVVARRARDGDGAAGRFRRRIDRPHVRTHQAGAPLRFVHGGDAELAERRMAAASARGMFRTMVGFIGPCLQPI